MSTRSTIEWTTHTWNPTTGCSRVGPECDNCYAMNMAHRFAWGRHLTRRHSVPLKVLGQDTRVKVDMVDWTGKIELHPDRLTEPFRWRAPAKVFVDSTSDLFHPSVGFHFVAAAIAVMVACPRHTFQILTKRPERMAEFWPWFGDFSIDNLFAYAEKAGVPALHLNDARVALRSRIRKGIFPSSNIWYGTSVGVREAKSRIEDLQRVPAHVRFLSLEPLLEDLGDLDLRGIGWVIAGGESGARARPMHPNWVRRIRDQCDEANVPFFFKQHGAYGDERTFAHCPGRRHTFPDGHTVVRVGKKKAGRQLDGRMHDAMPQTV